MNSIRKYIAILHVVRIWSVMIGANPPCHICKLMIKSDTESHPSKTINNIYTKNMRNKKRYITDLRVGVVWSATVGAEINLQCTIDLH